MTCNLFCPPPHWFTESCLYLSIASLLDLMRWTHPLRGFTAWCYVLYSQPLTPWQVYGTVMPILRARCLFLTPKQFSTQLARVECLKASIVQLEGWCSSRKYVLMWGLAELISNVVFSSDSHGYCNENGSISRCQIPAKCKLLHICQPWRLGSR